MSRFVFQRPPMLDRALAGLDRWWSGLSARERWLVGVLAALVVVAGLIYGVVKPLQAARAQALSTIRLYESLNTRILAAGRLNAAPQPGGGSALAVVQQSAGRNGVTAAVTPIGGGARAVVSDASYDALIAWIGDVQRSGGPGVTRATINRLGTPGRVSATLEFGR